MNVEFNQNYQYFNEKQPKSVENDNLDKTIIPMVSIRPIEKNYNLVLLNYKQAYVVLQYSSNLMARLLWYNIRSILY